MTTLIDRCRDAWMSLEPFRAGRRRCKRLAYGTDGASANNLVRQLIKSTVGRYRYLRAGGRVDLDTDARDTLDLDAKSLEEFLISGMAVNRRRIFPRNDATGFENVSPERMFFTRFSEPDGSDATMAGMLHDFPPVRLLQLFGNGDTGRCLRLLEHYRGRMMQATAVPCVEQSIEFDTPAMPERMRVIEVWESAAAHTLHCHDMLHAEYISIPYSEKALRTVRRINRRRSAEGKPRMVVQMLTDTVWHHTWLSPAGMVLAREVVPEAAFPFALLLYPMTDGETHSLVADVAPQQMHINRLVALLDKVIDQSAKGVLLFPTEQLPDGFTWQDMRRIWADPGGIIPYRRTSRSLSPQMVTSSGWNQGAAQMLQMQLDLFAEVSGLAPSFRGREAAFAGSEAARVDSENASIAMLDLMGAFHAFIARRNAMTRKNARDSNNLNKPIP